MVPTAIPGDCDTEELSLWGGIRGKIVREIRDERMRYSKGSEGR